MCAETSMAQRKTISIALIGAGRVGSALAGALSRAGHAVTLAVHDARSDSVQSLLAGHPELKAQPMPAAVAEAKVVFVSVPFGALEDALGRAGSLADKILVDCTNPVGRDQSHGLNSELSGGEYVQSLAPGARVVKAFNTYGFENLADSTYPDYGSLRPAMFLAGNDPAAKLVVAGLCEDLGWQPIDTGGLAMSLHLEHMALLWIKMARVQGHGAGFVWARLQR